MNVVPYTGIVAQVINAIDNAVAPIQRIEMNTQEMTEFLAVPEFKYAEGVGLTGSITNIKNSTNAGANDAQLPASFRFRNILIVLKL